MNKSFATERWLACVQPRPQASLRLFCFPHAGGGASLFRTWADSLPTAVEVCPVQLPGRETRFREPAFMRWEPLLQELTAGLRPYLDRPFAFFGHSMGALLGFELARRIRRLFGLQPLHFFASGCGAPHVRSVEKPIHDLPDREFQDALRGLKGTPASVLEHAELLELLLPTLRADFALCETYTHVTEAPLDCALSALGGLDDDLVGRAELEAWREHTTAPFRLSMVEGGHFFLQTARSVLLSVLGRELLRGRGAATAPLTRKGEAGPCRPHPGMAGLAGTTAAGPHDWLGQPTTLEGTGAPARSSDVHGGQL